MSVKDGDAPLTPAEFAAWGGLLTVHNRVARRLDEDLRRDHGMSLADYDALIHLYHADGRRLRMSALADEVHFSLGGMSKLVARLEGRGLVHREADPGDRRAQWACLTDEGARRLAAARSGHLTGIRRYFLDHLDAAETDLLGAVWQRVVDGRREEPGTGRA